MNRKQVRAGRKNMQDGSDVRERQAFGHEAAEAQSTSSVSMQNSTKSVQAVPLDLGQRIRHIFRSYHSHDRSLTMEQFLRRYADQYNERFPITDKQTFLEFLISQKDVVVFRDTYAGARRFFLDVQPNM